MDTLSIVALLLLAYGLACVYVALARPGAIWNLGKFQGFIQLLGQTGTVIMLLLLALATIIGGIALLLI